MYGNTLEVTYLSNITELIDRINKHQIQTVKFSEDFSDHPTELDFSSCESVTKILFDKSSNYDKNFLNLPPKLKVIRFSNSFNQKLPELPSTLEEIHFGSQFNHPINNLPSELKKLSLGKEFNQELYNLPIGLKHLSIRVEKLITLDLSNLPESLEYLNIVSHTIDNHNTNSELLSNLLSNLPNGLKNLAVSNSDYYNLDNLPDSIECLSLFNLTKIPNKFPSSAKNLTIEFGTVVPNPNNMMLDLSNTNIVMLVLSSKSYNQRRKLIFPENLEILVFDNDYYNFITLPTKIKYLFFGSGNNLCADNGSIRYELGQDSMQLMCTNGIR